jgi:hypothetical protein
MKSAIEQELQDEDGNPLPQRQRKKLSPEEAAIRRQRAEAREKAATASADFESDVADEDYGASIASGEEVSSDSDSSGDDVVMTNQEVSDF